MTAASCCTPAARCAERDTQAVKAGGRGVRQFGPADRCHAALLLPPVPADPAPSLLRVPCVYPQVLPGELEQMAAAFGDREAAIQRGLCLEGRRYEVRRRSRLLAALRCAACHSAALLLFHPCHLLDLALSPSLLLLPGAPAPPSPRVRPFNGRLRAGAEHGHSGDAGAAQQQQRRRASLLSSHVRAAAHLGAGGAAAAGFRAAIPGRWVSRMGARRSLAGATRPSASRRCPASCCPCCYT